MITILSPSKTINENPVQLTKTFTLPAFLNESEQLIVELRKYPPSKLKELMKVNNKIADLNCLRYIKWNRPFSEENSHRALLMFKGEVFNGLKAETLSESDLLYAQDHLRILSGLYGVLRPLDLMQAYRLEMGTSLENKKGINLYKFWGDNLTRAINAIVSEQKNKVLINLASDEYYKALNPKKIKARIIKCQFKEKRNGELKFITIYGKKARGLMTRYIIENRIEHPEDLKGFDYEGYYFNPGYSKENEFMFTRLGNE
jgi:cytoplasmic iron level regulating protein YaaA (DUF328/UPF0246 family)